MSDWSIIVPEASTNKVLNPVAGLATNVADVGGATVTQSTTYAYFGGWSHRVQTASDNDGIDITLDALANAIHYVSVRVRGDVSPWDWSLDNATFTAPALLSTEGDWSVYGLQFPAAQANGSTTLQIYQNGAGACDFYLGHIQVEEKSYATTPITGDRPGCHWNGVAHASASDRSAQSRAGGRVRDLYDTYSLLVQVGAGAGLSSNRHHTHDQALLPGSLFQGRKVLPRTLDLQLVIPGTSGTNLHSKRKAFIATLAWNKVKGDQPFILRYTGANTSKPIDLYCVYDSGLEFAPSTRIERVAARCIAYDPFFYNVHQTAAHLTTSLTVSDVENVIRKVDGTWANISAGFNDTVTTIAKGADGAIYIGGLFTGVGDGDGDGIVKLDLATGALSSLGTGVSGGSVYALALAPNGDIYAGGSFTAAGGVADTPRIARWDGTQWNAVSTGIGSGAVLSLAFGHDGKLYVGGSFTDHGDGSGDYITSWDGSAWDSLGTGMNEDVNGLAIAPNGDLVAVGEFTTAGGTTVNYVARWNGTAWSALSTGLSGGTTVGYAVAIDEAGNVYVGGSFTAAGGVSCSYIAKWNGAAWIPLGSGVNSVVYCLSIDENSLLHAGGAFTAAGGVGVADAIAVWNGSSWAHIDVNLPSSAVYAYLCDGDDAYIGYATIGSTATASYNNTLTNNGSADAYPKFTFKRSGGSWAILEYIKNETTGETLWCNYSLANGEELTIDLTQGNRSIKSSYFGDVWRAILRNSDVADFKLLPGANDVSVFVNNSGATLTAYALWNDAYLSADGAAP